MISMKTFAELKLNDTIFCINTSSGKFYDSKDSYGNIYSYSIFEKIKVNYLDMNDDVIRINYHKGYSRDSYLLRLKNEDLIKSQISIGDKVYFSDLSEAHAIIRQAVLIKMKEEEDSIKTHIDIVNKRIEEMRKKYYESLNYIDNPELP